MKNEAAALFGAAAWFRRGLFAFAAVFAAFLAFVLAAFGALALAALFTGLAGGKGGAGEGGDGGRGNEGEDGFHDVVCCCFCSACWRGAACGAGRRMPVCQKRQSNWR